MAAQDEEAIEVQATLVPLLHEQEEEPGWARLLPIPGFVAAAGLTKTTAMASTEAAARA
jgi:hypothetical protein